MKSKFVSVIYDRKKQAGLTGVGKVELCIYFSRGERKFITCKTCTTRAWQRYQKSRELKDEVTLYQRLAEKMCAAGEEMTIANLNKRLGIVPPKPRKTPKKNKQEDWLSMKDGFINFMLEQISKERFASGTIAHKKVAVLSLIRYGKMNRFKDLTPANVKAYDDFLHIECSRTQTTINNYHKVIRKYTQLAYQLGYIKSDPYKHPFCRFSRGTPKERCPLLEDELIMIRNLDGLSMKMERARDLFIFCAYTGLSYSDSQLFDFKTMAEERNGIYFINGTRVKTGYTYFTPILQPAMDVLKKYDYEVPKLTNQKANDYLHVIESRLELNKSLTIHVARHTFATLMLFNGTSLEMLAKMLGHANIKTTQIYAHVLKSAVEDHVKLLLSKIR